LQQADYTASAAGVELSATTSRTGSTAEVEYDGNGKLNLNGVRIEVRLQELEWARLNKAYDFRKEEELYDNMRNCHSPFETAFFRPVDPHCFTLT
jgi:hypothetical protein